MEKSVVLYVPRELAQDINNLVNTVLPDKYRVVGNIENPQEIIELVNSYKPDVLIVDRNTDPTIKVISKNNLLALQKVSPNTKIVLMLGEKDQIGLEMAATAIECSIYNFVFDGKGGVSSTELLIAIDENARFEDVKEYSRSTTSSDAKANSAVNVKIPTFNAPGFSTPGAKTEETTQDQSKSDDEETSSVIYDGEQFHDPTSISPTARSSENEGFDELEEDGFVVVGSHPDESNDVIFGDEKESPSEITDEVRESEMRESVKTPVFRFTPPEPATQPEPTDLPEMELRQTTTGNKRNPFQKMTDRMKVLEVRGIPVTSHPTEDVTDETQVTGVEIEPAPRFVIEEAEREQIQPKRFFLGGIGGKQRTEEAEVEKDRSGGLFRGLIGGTPQGKGQQYKEISKTHLIAVWSPKAGSGATSTVASLFTQASNSGLHPVAIDCHMDSPNLHLMFDVATPPNQQLTGIDTIREDSDIESIKRRFTTVSGGKILFGPENMAPTVLPDDIILNSITAGKELSRLVLVDIDPDPEDQSSFLVLEQATTILAVVKNDFLSLSMLVRGISIFQRYKIDLSKLYVLVNMNDSYGIKPDEFVEMIFDDAKENNPLIGVIPKDDTKYAKALTDSNPELLIDKNWGNVLDKLLRL